MKHLKFLVVVVFASLAVLSFGDAIKILGHTRGTWNPANSPARFLTLTLDRDPTEAEKALLENPDLYVVTEEPATTSTPVTPQTSGVVLSVSSKPVVMPISVRLPISGQGFGKGTVRLNPAVAGTLVTMDSDSVWIIAKGANMAQKVDTDFSTSYDKNNFAAKFAFSSPSFIGKASRARLLAHEDDIVRESFSFSGNVPFGKPSDSQSAGTSADSSQQIADFLSLSFEQRVYNGDSYQALGFIARSTGSARGVEVVADYVPYVHIDLNRGTFVGTSFEAGYRSGDAEWTSLTTKAPSTGNVVARLGGVFEYMPKLGLINADRTDGLRFFARARGWMDYYKNPAGTSTTRFQHFLDAEFFYNFSTKYRVFVRGEQGYFLPNLSKRVGRVYIGVGTAF